MSAPQTARVEQVFLSYSRTDREACIALRTILEKAGLSVYRDEDSNRAGDRWISRLEQTLHGCSAFVLLVGRDGVTRWVGAEVQMALSRHFSPHHEAERLPIFPVLLDAAAPETLPPLLQLFQATRWDPHAPVPPDLLKAVREGTTRLAPLPPFEGNPFRGLNAFQQADVKLFFGRRPETLEALRYLGDQQESNPEALQSSASGAYHRWLEVAGNSGAGKSSLVNAGLLPMIRQGALWARTGFECWTILGPMMPGHDPVEALASAFETALIADPTRRDSLARKRRFYEDERALALAIKDFNDTGMAVLLVIDQFEELFTFSDEAARQQFDALLAAALRDPGCPLFLISTVRADFLDRFELLPRLQVVRNSHCKHYSLPLVTEHGLREIIEEPARLAGLDVTEITAAILEDARGEPGALPLVENALETLWQHRAGNRLSGEEYRRQNGIAGMLSSRADALLERIGVAVPKGKEGALDLLLRLTQVSDQGRHTRRRITREVALIEAGEGDAERGERVVRMLSGERPLDAPIGSQQGALRLVTVTAEEKRCETSAPEVAGSSGNKKPLQFVDLIHETLIRAREDAHGARQPYWPTLYTYIEQNRDRDIHRQQLEHDAQEWRRCSWLGRLWYVAGWRELRRYRRLRYPKDSLEHTFIVRSRWTAAVQLGLLLLLAGVLGESAWWATANGLPFGYTFVKPLWMLGYKPLPELVPIKPDKFTMGCLEGRDDVPAQCGKYEKPAHEVTIAEPFRMGKYEVTFMQYDRYVWSRQGGSGSPLKYPPDAGFGRFDRPVINVSWFDAKAYAEWLGAETGQNCRLPTEAEWEYAARAGTSTAYWWGSQIEKGRANCADCGSEWDRSETAPVGSFKANPWGLHDTAGNVWEWVSSSFKPYPYRSDDGREDPETKVGRVLRGGSWDDIHGFARASARYYGDPDGRLNGFGFRVVCVSAIR